MKTFLPKQDEIVRKWWVIDADGVVLGRLASKVADILRGKDKPTFTPHLDCGDFVIVINAAKVHLTGGKETGKIYKRYSGHIGGLKEMTAAQVRARNPERMIEEAVWGMLPKGRLGRQQYRKLKVYPGGEHPHTAQTPEPLALKPA
jgi:large subunit ribosomal protein L13